MISLQNSSFLQYDSESNDNGIVFNIYQSNFNLNNLNISHNTLNGNPLLKISNDPSQKSVFTAVFSNLYIKYSNENYLINQILSQNSLIFAFSIQNLAIFSIDSLYYSHNHQFNQIHFLFDTIDKFQSSKQYIRFHSFYYIITILINIVSISAILYIQLYQ